MQSKKAFATSEGFLMRFSDKFSMLSNGDRDLAWGDVRRHPWQHCQWPKGNGMPNYLVANNSGVSSPATQTVCPKTVPPPASAVPAPEELAKNKEEIKLPRRWHGVDPFEKG